MRLSPPGRRAERRGLRLWHVWIVLPLTFTAALAIAAGVFLAGWDLLSVRGLKPEHHIDSTTLFDLVKLSFGVVAGAGALVALVVAYRRQRVDEDGALREATRLHTERFTTAVSQLGEESAAVRLGGVHALAGLADDAPTRELRQTCIDVLCAYLRLPYVAESALSAGDTDARHAYLALREVRHTIIRLICDHLRLPLRDPRSWQGHDFDFTGVVFDGGDFIGAQFSGSTVRFGGAQFSGGTVDFTAAQFSGSAVDFSGAKFSSGTVSFSGAKFSSGTVNFHRVQFSGGTVGFIEVEFSGGAVLFTGMEFSGSPISFFRVQFSGGMVDFNGTQFTSGTVNFSGAQFSSGTGNFDRAQFSGSAVDFSGTQFSGSAVNFNGTQFTSGTVNFSRAEFSSGTVDFSGTQFSGGRVGFFRATGVPPTGLVPPSGVPLPAGLILPAAWS
ncbi:pentapeptide repeat-containing protein [Streptomyces justiciae]|uniref:pentapeptide repeat-containing protein n=1 Tax=Streptomyces justiciae TaxID=2780140 RepID=UPI002AD4DEAE|nr:pentapeptide repeat-containing protein [Streptomyces justiciae]